MARKHWTPVSVAKTASEFLADRPGARVASNAGKGFKLLTCNENPQRFQRRVSRGDITSRSFSL